jgi:hypothetical protein
MRIFVGAVSLALAASCMPQAGNAPVGGEEVQIPAVVEATPDPIAGTYIVAQVGGEPPIINIEGHAPTVTIGEKRIHFQSQCIYADWTYELDGETISTKSYYEPGSAMCARGLAPGEVAIQEALEAADRVRRTDHGLQVEGGGHRLELRRIGERAAD